MIYTTDTMEIEEACEKLIATLISSPLAKEYVTKKEIMDTDEAFLKEKNVFLEKKAAFEKISQYGTFAPDFKKQQLSVRREKRKLDMLETVADFTYAQTEFQEQLDKVAIEISSVISENIKVDYGNPFFHKSSHAHCKGGC